MCNIYILSLEIKIICYNLYLLYIGFALIYICINSMIVSILYMHYLVFSSETGNKNAPIVEDMTVAIIMLKP